MASSEDGDRAQVAVLHPHPQQASAKRKISTARRGTAAGKTKARSVPEAPPAIRLADPVRCVADGSMLGPSSEPQYSKVEHFRRRSASAYGSVATYMSHHSTNKSRRIATASCRADEWHRHHQSVDPSASDSGRDDSHPMTGRSSAHSVQSSHDSPRSSGAAECRMLLPDFVIGHLCTGSVQRSTRSCVVSCLLCFGPHYAAVRWLGFLPRPPPAPGQDEYSDDDDPGYWREPVRRQDAFVLTELKHSDDESSPGRRAYHR